MVQKTVIGGDLAAWLSPVWRCQHFPKYWLRMGQEEVNVDHWKGDLVSAMNLWPVQKAVGDHLLGLRCLTTLNFWDHRHASSVSWLLPALSQTPMYLPNGMPRLNFEVSEMTPEPV